MNVQPRNLLNVFLTACLLIAPVAEAKRAGGGKSMGMSRSNNTSYQQPQYNAPKPAPVQQKTGSNVGKMVAAGAAGVAVGAIAANAMADDRPASAAQQNMAEQPAKGLPTWLWFILIAGLAFFIFRKFGAKKKLANNPYAPNNAGGSRQHASHSAFGQNGANTASSNNSTASTNIFGQTVGGAPVFGSATTQSQQQLPDGTEPAAFLRVARQRFNHIQSINSASNVDEIRRYLTPELFAQMHQDIVANRDQDVAEFSNLKAMVDDSATENGQYVVSVRFTGTVSEDLNSLPQPFAEIWHFVKPINSANDWVVAGIQQA